MESGRKRVSRIYKCEYALFVTNWHGVYLNKEIRDKLKLNDIVRVIITTDKLYATRYIQIKSISDKYFKGVVADPYHGYCFLGCNVCNKSCNLQAWSCTNGFDKNDGMNNCNYHLCDKCYKKHGKSHEHPFKLYKHSFCQGTIVVFKKTNVMEIPDWSSNTTKLIEKYKQPRGRLFTGIFLK